MFQTTLRAWLDVVTYAYLLMITNLFVKKVVVLSGDVVTRQDEDWLFFYRSRCNLSDLNLRRRGELLSSWW